MVEGEAWRETSQQEVERWQRSGPQAAVVEKLAIVEELEEDLGWPLETEKRSLQQMLAQE